MTYRHLLLGASFLLNLVLLWALVWGGQSLGLYKELKQEFEALSKRTADLSEKNLRLSREIKLLESDNKYLEQVIRKRLNYIKENEIWYIFPEDSGVEDTNEAKN